MAFVPLFLLVSMDSKPTFRYEDMMRLWLSLPPPVSSTIVAMLHGDLLWRRR